MLGIGGEVIQEQWDESIPRIEGTDDHQEARTQHRHEKTWAWLWKGDIQFFQTFLYGLMTQTVQGHLIDDHPTHERKSDVASNAQLQEEKFNR